MIALATALATFIGSAGFLIGWWGISTYLIEHNGWAFLAMFLIWGICKYYPIVRKDKP